MTALEESPGSGISAGLTVFRRANDSNSTKVSVRSSSLEKGIATIVDSLKKSNGTSKNGSGDVSAGRKLAEERAYPEAVQPAASD